MDTGLKRWFWCGGRHAVCAGCYGGRHTACACYNTRRHTAWACCIMGVVGLALLAGGCSRAGGGPEAADGAHSPYRLAEEPAGAVDVKTAHTDAQDAEEVVIAGLVGGNSTPWVEGLAAFTIVDLSLRPCEDACTSPCGMAVVPGTQALVRIVDPEGRTVPTDARRLLGIEHWQTVVVRGEARRDEAGNLTILADGAYVRP